MLIELVKDALHFQVISIRARPWIPASLPRFSDADKKKLRGDPH
jgi:hypothetical protein